MKQENGIKERIAERKMGVKNGRESKETEQFIPVAEQKFWREPLDIIATKGFIRGIKL